MDISTKRLTGATALGIVALTAGGAALTANAATTSAPSHAPSSTQQTAHENPMKTKLDALVKSGKITAAQEKDILAAMPSHGQGFGHKGRPGFGGGMNHAGSGHRGGRLTEVAQAIGVSTSSLESSLKSGQSIAQVAQSKGISEDSLISKLQADQAAHLKKFVESTHKAGTAKPGSSSSSSASTAPTDSASTTPAS